MTDTTTACFSYRLIRSKRKTVAIQLAPDGGLIVRAPERCPQSFIDGFVMEKRQWIEKKRQELARRETERKQGRAVVADGFCYPETEAEEQIFREQAAEIFAQKAAYYARQMGVAYQRITIRDQKTRWGSCSSKGNLNFNWRLVLAPVKVLDYVVIHELAHLKEMNHSSRFWGIVEEMMPDYRNQRKWLRDQGDILFSKSVL